MRVEAAESARSRRLRYAMPFADGAYVPVRAAPLSAQTRRALKFFSFETPFPMFDTSA